MAPKTRRIAEKAVVLAAVGSDGAREADERLTFDTEVRQVLIEITGTAQKFEHTMLLERVEGSTWVTMDSDLTQKVESIAGERVVVLGRNSQFPIADRPFLIMPELSAGRLSELVMQGRRLAELYRPTLPTVLRPGLPVPMAPATSLGQWYFGDSGHPHFGTPVPLSCMADSTGLHIEGWVGLLKYNEGGSSERWTFIEYIEDSLFARWIEEKREGAGRDVRLLPLHETKGKMRRPLFREAAEHFSRPSMPRADIFEGPSAAEEITDGIVESGLEPQGYARAVVQESGLTAKGVVTELKVILYTFFLLGCVDRLNCHALAACEHLGRRAMQLLEATARNAKAPDFEHLDGYLAHMAEPGTTARAGKFASHVADRQKLHANVMKQIRLSKEEEAHAAKARGGGGGGGGRGAGKNGGKGE